MEWLFDPLIWVALLTLVTLEIVLGIDNIIFIAILTDKLPSHQRDKARIMGLTLAMIMRLLLLSLIFWLVTLTKPLFYIGSLSFSGRDLILLFGGLFLLFKATVELHERLDGISPASEGERPHANFGLVIAQIVVLDAVFSIDAVITAVGMVDQLWIMMAAVVISIGVMILASKPLTRFVNAHQTVIVLCLSFLLMIGFSLVAEGLGFKIPKAYLYAAIGFSILIEFFNQLARRNLIKNEAHISFRERTAAAVLHMLARSSLDSPAQTADALGPTHDAFAEEERNMVRGTLTLAERKIRSIMTLRSDISWINLCDSIAVIHHQLLETPHSFLLVCRGTIDNIVGIARAKDLIASVISNNNIDETNLKTPIVLHETWGVIKAIEMLKRAGGQLLIIVDEYGEVRGLVTPIDILEAIAGEFPDEDEQVTMRQIEKNRWQVDGAVDLYHLEQELDVDFLIDDHEYTTLAGFLITRFDKIPDKGDVLEFEGFRFEVLKMSEQRIVSVLITKQ